MDHFEYREGKLFCEDVPIRAIAKKVGTPFYLYSYATFARHFNVFDSAFSEMPHVVCYSLKANPNGALLRIIAQSSGGADIVSGGELFRALSAGIPAESRTAAQMRSFLALLQKWNARVNLTASAEWEDVGPLFEEAVWAASLYPGTAATHLDIGSGAGFPALLLHIMLPHLRLDLVESRGRRCLFLETAVRDLSLETTRVFHERLESFLTRGECCWDCISWKGIRLRTRELRMLACRASPQTRFWMFHGREAAAEDPRALGEVLVLVRREACPARKGWWLSELRKSEALAE